MKMNEEEFDKKIKKVIEEDMKKVTPKLSKDEMWGEIEKKRKAKHKPTIKRIPVYASSFIALAASLFFVLTIPNMSEQVKVENNVKKASVEETFQEIETATLMIEEKVVSKMADSSKDSIQVYPSYLPEGYLLEKEEEGEQTTLLYYRKGEESLIIRKTKGEPAMTMMRAIEQEENKVTEEKEGVTVEVEGKLSHDELTKIAKSMFEN